LHVGISVLDTNDVPVFGCMTTMTTLRDFRDVPSHGEVVCKVTNLPLIPGRYWVTVMIKDDDGMADLVDRAARFSVVDGGRTGFLDMPSRSWGGSVVVPHTWEWRPPSGAELLHASDESPTEIARDVG
jgi:hypothetical protein